MVERLQTFGVVWKTKYQKYSVIKLSGLWIFQPPVTFFYKNSNSVYYTGSLLAFKLSRDLNSSLKPKLYLNTKSSVKPILRLTLVLELGLKLSFRGKDRLETQFKTELRLLTTNSSWLPWAEGCQSSRQPSDASLPYQTLVCLCSCERLQHLPGQQKDRGSNPVRSLV